MLNDKYYPLPSVPCTDPRTVRHHDRKFPRPVSPPHNNNIMQLIRQQNLSVPPSPTITPKWVIRTKAETDMEKEKRELLQNMKQLESDTRAKDQLLKQLASEASSQRGLVRCKNCNKKLLYPKVSRFCLACRFSRVFWGTHSHTHS